MLFMDQRGMAILHVTTRMCLEDKSPIRGSNWPEFVSHLVGPLMCRTRLTVYFVRMSHLVSICFKTYHEFYGEKSCEIRPSSNVVYSRTWVGPSRWNLDSCCAGCDYVFMALWFTIYVLNNPLREQCTLGMYIYLADMSYPCQNRQI